MEPADPSRLTRCAFALGRLSMAVERSPLRPLWLGHETARVVARLFSRGAEPMSAEELLALSAGVSDGVPSVGAAAARRFWSQASHLWRMEVPGDRTGNVLEVTKLLGGLSAEGMPPGELALEAPLRLGAETGWPLPCAALALPPESTKERWRERFIAGLAAEAEQSLARLEALERDFSRWLSLLPEARSDSRLKDAVVLLGTAHALTPRYLVETLGLTRQASARLLKKMESLGILRRATARQRWIIYLAQNAAPAGLVPESTTEKSRVEVIDTAEIDRVLESAYAALDRSVRRDG